MGSVLTSLVPRTVRFVKTSPHVKIVLLDFIWIRRPNSALLIIVWLIAPFAKIRITVESV